MSQSHATFLRHSTVLPAIQLCKISILWSLHCITHCRSLNLFLCEKFHTGSISFQKNCCHLRICIKFCSLIWSINILWYASPLRKFELKPFAIPDYYVLINRAGGLYRRILTEVASTDQMQWGLYQRPRSRFSSRDWPYVWPSNKMFILWPNKKVALKTSLEATQSTWLALIAILFTNRDEKFRRKKVELVGRYIQLL